MTEFKTIVLTTDLSDTSRHAFGPASAIARKFGSRLIVLHVVEDRLPPFVDEFTAVPLAEILESQEKRAEEELDSFVANLRREHPELETVVVQGIPHREIVRVSAERSADLIVMATRGHGLLTHALFGSTTGRVVCHASCAVLTVRGPAA